MLTIEEAVEIIKTCKMACVGGRMPAFLVRTTAGKNVWADVGQLLPLLDAVYDRGEKAGIKHAQMQGEMENWP